MNTCCTSSTHAKTFSLGKPQTDLNPTRSPGEKLEFVEHILGVLIDSRHGEGMPYQRLGEPAVMTGHSQMFANVRLLSAAEITAHLEFGGVHRRPFHVASLRELPLALANGSWLKDLSGFSPTLFWAKAREVLAVLIRRLKPTAIQRTQNDHSFMPRGSPTFLRRSSSRPPLRP